MIWPNFGNFKHPRIKKKSLLRLEMRQDPNQSQQLHFTCNDPMHHDLARNLLGNTVLHFTIVTTCTGKAVLSVVQYEGPVCIVCEGESHCHVRSMAQKDRPWSTQIYPWWSQFVDQWAFPMIPFVGQSRMVFVSYRGSSLFFSDCDFVAVVLRLACYDMLWCLTFCSFLFYSHGGQKLVCFVFAAGNLWGLQPVSTWPKRLHGRCWEGASLSSRPVWVLFEVQELDQST